MRQVWHEAKTYFIYSKLFQWDHITAEARRPGESEIDKCE